MEKLDREYQLRILQAAADVYPQQLLVHGELLGRSGAEIEINCAYLEEHKFVELSWVGSPNSGRVVVSVAATAAGIDYLKNDGGVKSDSQCIDRSIRDRHCQGNFYRKSQKCER